jgi:hypothetical protein
MLEVMSAITLNLASSHQRASVTAVSERMRFWVGDRPAEAGREGRPARARLAEPGLALERRLKEARRGHEAEPRLDPKTEKILKLLERVFGMKGVRAFAIKMEALKGDVQTAQQQQQPNWGLEYDRTEVRAEIEESSLRAEGTFTLDDGRSFAFSLSFTQRRESVSVSHQSLRLGNAVAKDPLALDLDGDGLAFTSDLTALDLDRDGSVERFRSLAAGDAWLAYDRDGDGRVSDGSELFGPATGQGFAELAALDADDNGLVDAGDAAWARLGLWNGARLTPLAQSGVAAIATASVALPFAHQASDGSAAAAGRSGGVWLGEDGRAGAAMQVDVYV